MRIGRRKSGRPLYRWGALCFVNLQRAINIAFKATMIIANVVYTNKLDIVDIFTNRQNKTRTFFISPISPRQKTKKGIKMRVARMRSSFIVSLTPLIISPLCLLRHSCILLYSFVICRPNLLLWEVFHLIHFVFCNNFLVIISDCILKMFNRPFVVIDQPETFFIPAVLSLFEVGQQLKYNDTPQY